MTLGELIRLAEAHAEDWPEFHVEVVGSNGEHTAEVAAVFDVHEGAMTFLPVEEEYW